MEVVPFSVAMTMFSKTVLEPTANFSNSKTPTGPFQTMVAARSMTEEKVAMDCSPTSRPIQSSGIPVSMVAWPTCGGGIQVWKRNISEEDLLWSGGLDFLH